MKCNLNDFPYYEVCYLVLDEFMLSYSFLVFLLGDLQTVKVKKVKVTRL